MPTKYGFWVNVCWQVVSYDERRGEAKRQQSFLNEESFSLEMTGVYVEWLPRELTVGSVVDFGLWVRSQLIKLSRSLTIKKFLHSKIYQKILQFMYYIWVLQTGFVLMIKCANPNICMLEKLIWVNYVTISIEKRDSGLNFLKYVKLWKFVINILWPIKDMSQLSSNSGSPANKRDLIFNQLLLFTLPFSALQNHREPFLKLINKM